MMNSEWYENSLEKSTCSILERTCQKCIFLSTLMIWQSRGVDGGSNPPIFARFTLDIIEFFRFEPKNVEK